MQEKGKGKEYEDKKTTYRETATANIFVMLRPCKKSEKREDNKEMKDESRKRKGRTTKR